MNDPFKILGVTPDAPEFVIQAAYRACLKRYHPDHYKGSDAATRTGEVVAAYKAIAELRRTNRATEEPAESKSHKGPKAAPTSSTKAEAPATIALTPNERPSWLMPAILGVVALMIVLAARTQDPSGSGDAAMADTAMADVEMSADAAMLETAGGVDSALLPQDPASAALEAADAASEAADLIDGMVLRDQSLSFATTPVSFSNVESGAQKFASVLQRTGIAGARAYSERCHKVQSEQPTWDGLDFCASFDFSARALDRGFTAGFGGANAYFQFQSENQSDYYQGRYVATRLASIRRASEAALIVAMSDLEDETTAAKPGSRSDDPTPSVSNAQVRAIQDGMKTFE